MTKLERLRAILARTDMAQGVSEEEARTNAMQVCRMLREGRFVISDPSEACAPDPAPAARARSATTYACSGHRYHGDKPCPVCAIADEARRSGAVDRCAICNAEFLRTLDGSVLCPRHRRERASPKCKACGVPIEAKHVALCGGRCDACAQALRDFEEVQRRAEGAKSHTRAGGPYTDSFTDAFTSDVWRAFFNIGKERK